MSDMVFTGIRIAQIWQSPDHRPPSATTDYEYLPYMSTSLRFYFLGKKSRLQSAG